MKNNIPTIEHNQQLVRKILSAANEFASAANLANDTRQIRAAFETLFETWQDVEQGFVEEDEPTPEPDRPEEFEGQDALLRFMGRILPVAAEVYAVDRADVGVGIGGGGDMHKSTAAALYALHIDCFLEGLAEEVVKPAEFQLTEVEARVVRKLRYADKIREIRNRRVA